MKPINRYSLIGHTISTIFINPNKHWVVITLDNNETELVIIAPDIKSNYPFTKNWKQIDTIDDITIKDIGWDNMGGINNLFIVDDIGDVYRINCIVNTTGNMNIYHYTNYKKKKEARKRRRVEKVRRVKSLLGINDHYEVI